MQIYFFKNTKTGLPTVTIDCDFPKNWGRVELITEEEYNKIAVSRGLCSSQQIRQNILEDRAIRATGEYINIDGKRVTRGN